MVCLASMTCDLLLSLKIVAGESEKMLSQIFEAAEKLDSCLVFLDEIDSLATSRG